MGSKSKAPAAPDYTKLATEQGVLNDAATAKTDTANRPTQNTAFGSTTWTTDASGKPVQTTTLNEADQTRLDTQRGVQQGQIELAGGLLGQARDSMGQPIDTSGMTKYGSNSTTSGFGAVQEVQDAMMGRLRPDLERARASERQRLVNSGIAEDSGAYQRAMERRDRAETDASQQALMGAVGAQNTLFNQGLAGNTSADRQRAQQMEEAAALRELPMNEMLKLQQASGQVTDPTMPGFKSSVGYDAPDMMGAADKQYKAAMNEYNAKQAKKSSMLGSIAGLAGTVLGGPVGGMLGGAVGSMFGGGSTGAPQLDQFDVSEYEQGTGSAYNGRRRGM